MKRTDKAAKPTVAELAREVEEVVTGVTTAARVAEISLGNDGLVSRRLVDPESARSEAARNFAIRSPVARVRHALNLSQEAFSRRLRIPLSTVQKWERNATKPTGAAATLIEILEKRPEVIEVITGK